MASWVLPKIYRLSRRILLVDDRHLKTEIDLFETWLQYVEQFSELFEYGRQLPVVASATASASQSLPLNSGRHTVVICSPHPDDEALSGALPLRLQGEDTRVLNLAMTLGSNPARQKQRQAELAACCRVLDFDCRLVHEPRGFSNISRAGETADTITRQERIDILTGHFNRELPELILFPHARDGHPAHEEVHRLAMAAARQHSETHNRKMLLAETEYWHPMSEPNLVLGLTPATIARLITALLCHQGEIDRNPYHLSLPARLIDNARRGVEIAHHGGRGVQFPFAEIYRLSWLENGRLQPKKRGMALTIPPENILTLNELQAL
jgi:LmbE family N-acetylglucosaminyl deacetylase